MQSLKYEITRTPPRGAPVRIFVGGTPILYAYGCALLENHTDDGFVYKIVNLETGKTKTLSHRKTPLAPSEIEKVAERIRDCDVAGIARFEADRKYGELITYDKCREILVAVFNQILPEYGYAVRDEQIALAESILKTIYDRKSVLAEAEVGSGKTLAYLAATIIAKRGRLNDFWNKAYYPKMSYVDMAQMPIVIATSSIALQKAIVTEYIPELSRILVENGIIRTPLTAALRKGREHYACERKLRSHLNYEHNEKLKKILNGLLTPQSSIDLADVDGLDSYTKRKISVPGKCDAKCPKRDTCSYLKFRNRAMSQSIDVQVVNHNYFLADALHKAQNKRPLLPNYQTVIIDEAHKFLSASRSMYGTEFSSFTLPELKDRVFDLRFVREAAHKLARKTARKLSDESKRLFKTLESNSRSEDTDDEATRFTAVIDADTARHLRNMRKISNELYELLDSEPVTSSGVGKKSDILWGLSSVREQLAALTRYSDNICWLEKPDVHTTPGILQETLLCSIPKNIDAKLFEDLWSRGIPTILTSGTLSAGGDFTHMKRTLGLDKLGNRLNETSTPSPFNHRENALLYISENTPFPDQSDKSYIAAIADETEALIQASRGHAAVLFTSYKAMDLVWERLKQRGLPFPLFRLDKGGVRELERFKKSKGGVLFASGALWEGINIPGDALSMLIIVKLPFQVPDPIGEYERTLYKDLSEYKSRVVVPEMLIKLKQGFGRLIRSETDTGVVAILDSRASESGAYRERVLAALPDCRVTSDISGVASFIKAKKPLEYFR
jgi:ATP-dependent DNA helicase DinG